MLLRFAYMLDFVNLLHGRLGHVSNSYIMKMQTLGLISGISDLCTNKCDICVEAKLTRKPCIFVEREFELLNLIHTDLGDLKQTMTRDGKRYYITFIDDCFRYTKVYLLRNKDGAFNMFVSYKSEVENQLNKKIKELDQIEGANT